ERVRTSNNHITWLKRGCQRRAVAQAIYKPMTMKQILERACLFAPRIQLRDVWSLLRELERKEFVYCLTPRLLTGKVYFLTGAGRKQADLAFGQSIADPPRGIDWHRFAQVVRAKIRHSVLEAIARERWMSGVGNTASEIRKQLAERRSVALSQVLRVLPELTELQLVRSFMLRDNKRSKRYVLTPMGRKIVRELKR